MSFRWIAAGAAYNAFSNINIYVRFKQRKGGFKESIFPHGHFAALQDREIFITKPGGLECNIPFPLTNYDLCFNCDMLGQHSTIEHTGIMYAYTEKASLRRHSYDKSKVPGMLFGDSGGFQILTGVLDFVDPHDLGTWYKKYVKQGMSLDIPTGRCLDEELVLKSARIQKKNNAILKKSIDATVDIYNVCHGITYDLRSKFIDIVYDDDFNNWAVGGTGGTVNTNIFNMLSALFSVIKHSPKDAYHVLGVSKSLVIPILAWFGKYYNLTSDSSSHMQSGLGYGAFNLTGYKLQTRKYGTSTQDVLHSKSQYPFLPCSCGICQALKTNEFLYNTKRAVSAQICLVMHNLNSLARYAGLWNSLAQECTAKEYKQHLLQCIPPKEKVYWLAAIDCIENFVAGGNFKQYANNMVKKVDTFDATKCSLFTAVDQKEDYTAMKNVIKNFELFHKGGKIVPKRNKDKEIASESYK